MAADDNFFDDTFFDDTILTLRLSHEEAGSIYAVLMAVLDLGVFEPSRAANMQSIVEKLKAAQVVAITERAQTESAKGKPQ